MKKLSPKQIQAIGLLISGESITATAKKLKIDRSNIHSWFSKNPLFVARYNELRKELVRNAEDMMLNFLTRVTEALEDCLNSEDVTIKFRAATFVLDRMRNTPTGLTNAADIVREDFKKPLLSDDIMFHFDRIGFHNRCEELGIEEG